ncbi:MAG TPA: M20/M25/M40 family metallo-hydrolase [Longimicrobium sp.]|nr:M20/M25/M40 family metallo-hydrolase [Longimicrobium sp.]
MHLSIRRGVAPLLTVFALCAAASAACAQAVPPLDSVYRADANRLIQAALSDSFGWKRLATLTDRFGHRLSGSRALEDAIDWSLDQMRRDGLQNVRGEPVTVPHWVRGRESATLLSPRETPLHMLGLGGSVGTPPEGITADVIVVGSEEELAARGAEARGKIILFDVPFTSYREVARWRSLGAIAAAKAGAAAALIRSVASFSMQTPHTGSMRYYDTTVVRVPIAALSVEDAMMLHRMQNRGERVRVRLMMGAQTLPDAQSRNVVAEIVGREKPDEVVVISGHLDSWDVGTGAMDDAGGSVAAWEAVRLMQRLGLRPRRTVRVVLWTNEENGIRGGTTYRDTHRAQLDRHVLAIESDNGVFRPFGFRFQGSAAGLAMMQQVARLLEPIGAGRMVEGPGEADVGPMIALGVPGLALDVDGTKYFWYHHSDADTIDKLDPQEFAKCVAAMAVAAYVVADMPGTLPRQVPAPAN